MNWFRFYNRVSGDSKVQDLPIELRWRWVECLCMASENDTRGVLPPLRQIAFVMRVDRDEAREIVAQLVEAELVEENEDTSFSIHDWGEYQPRSDDSSDRVKKHRDKQKGDVKRACNGDPPLRNGGVTAQSRARREQSEMRAPPSGGEQSEGSPPAAAKGTHEECVEEARRLFGDQAAAVVEAKRDDIARTLGGRFDCYAAALRELARRQKKPGAKRVENFHRLTLTIAGDWVGGEVPPEPVAVEAVAREPPLSPREERRLREEEALREACRDLPEM